ncbi:extensin family protein [Rubellimicrobium rubrum]|uniref:extensin family protein n=1 Tax=Rubellimicrobium rubrum TaxID=2585369 RepID=UPI00159BB3E8|nr:extensin family protein [Rubellimicrobium rubrum]
MPPLLALGLIALAEAVVAQQAPEGSLRPEPRPLSNAPVRPGPRTDRGSPPVDLVRPGDEPAAQDAAPSLGRPAIGGGSIPDLQRDVLPPVPRQPPLIETEPPEPKLEGSMGIVRAEELMTEPPPVPVMLDGWDGSTPPTRPDAEPRRAEPPKPGRPRLRPLPPQDPRPLLPPEPDAPPAYAPETQPDILPIGPEYSRLAVARVRLPTVRPPDIVEQAARRQAALIQGQVCGNPGLQGEVTAAIRSGNGCGIEEPVEIRSVDGIALSEPATMDCVTAEALLEWTRDGARPAVGSRGGGLVGLQVMGSYSCRPRNNQAGARLSEHGRGRAVDIGAAILADGSRIEVLRDWPDPALRAMREAACQNFSTVLGPGSDAFHDDHLHLDTARGRGALCR